MLDVGALVFVAKVGHEAPDDDELDDEEEVEPAVEGALEPEPDVAAIVPEVDGDDANRVIVEDCPPPTRSPPEGPVTAGAGSPNATQSTRPASSRRGSASITSGVASASSARPAFAAVLTHVAQSSQKSQPHRQRLHVEQEPPPPPKERERRLETLSAGESGARAASDAEPGGGEPTGSFESCAPPVHGSTKRSHMSSYSRACACACGSVCEYCCCCCKSVEAAKAIGAEGGNEGGCRIDTKCGGA